MDRQHRLILAMLPDPFSRPHKEKKMGKSGLAMQDYADRPASRKTRLREV